MKQNVKGNKGTNGSQLDATITNFIYNYIQLLLASKQADSGICLVAVCTVLNSSLKMKACVKQAAPEDGRNYGPKHVELNVIAGSIVGALYHKL